MGCHRRYTRLKIVLASEIRSIQGSFFNHNDLIKEEVIAIIGHAISGQDEYFFRIACSLETRAHSLARHTCQVRGINRLATVYDTDNTAYSKTFLEAFASQYQSLGGTVTAETDFSSKAKLPKEFRVHDLRHVCNVHNLFR